MNFAPKSGGIVGNILIEAKDLFAAISKLKKRYPGCEILEAKEKRAQKQPPGSTLEATGRHWYLGSRNSSAFLSTLRGDGFRCEAVAKVKTPRTFQVPLAVGSIWSGP